jgi:DNA-binding MarR family transcriptional regulator
VIEDSIATIANYFWKQSIDHINRLFSDEERRRFSVNDYYYLTVISQMGESKMGDVAAALHLTKPSVTVMVERLKKAGLVSTSRSQTDRRVVLLRLTDKGAQLIQGDNAMYGELADSVLGQLTDAQRADAECLLGMVAEHITGQIEGHAINQIAEQTQ